MAIRIDGTNTAANPGITGADADTGLQFGTDEVSIVTGGTTRATVDSSGNVGIGTTSPGNPLAISQTVSTTFGNAGTYLGLGGTENTSGQQVLIGFGYKAASGDEYPAVIGYTATSNAGNQNGAIVFGTRAVTTNTAPTERARIDSSGRLLVGTSATSNTCKIQLSNGNAAAPYIETGGTNRNANGLNKWLIFRHGYWGGSQEVASIGVETTSSTGGNGYGYGNIVFYTGSSGNGDGGSTSTERMRIDSSGILTAMGVYANTTGTTNYVSVTSSGLLLRSTSSAKYKQNIETLEDSYADALLNVRPVWYKSTSKFDNPAHSFWGFIAEEVAAIDPRLVNWKTIEVTYDENGSAVETPCDPEPEGVAYDRFVPHLLNLIKRQKEQIESQSTAIAALETRLTALEGGSN